MNPTRTLPDGRLLEVRPMTYGKHRLTVSPREGSAFYDDGW